MENNNRNNPGKCAAKVPPAYHCTTQKYDVFISYSSHDQKVAEGVCAYLEQHRIRCFVAYRDIPKGVVWARAIVEALEESRMMVIVFSENFNRSEQVDREIELASEDHMPILTFRIADDAFRGAKKYYLKNLNWIDAFPHPEHCFGELCKNVQQLLGVDEKKASEPEDAQAQFELGRRYFYGKGVPQDCAEAVRWFRKAAEQEHAEAQYYLGKCYDNSLGVQLNKDKSNQWLRKAAEQGLTKAKFRLVVDTDRYLLYSKPSEYDKFCEDIMKEMPKFRENAEQGDADIQFLLGFMYRHGAYGLYDKYGVRKDLKEAARWYRKAAEQGDAEAQLHLGSLYETGEGVAKNDAEAVRWYRKAAEQGNAYAQYELAKSHEYGNGVQKSHVEAVRWYRKAAQQGNVPARYALKKLGETL